MHRPKQPHAAVLAALLLIGLPTPASVAATPEVLAEARALLHRGEASNAVTFLEGSLAAATPENRSALLDLLKVAYTAAAKVAESRGQPGDAELYRDNLEILNRNDPATRPAPPQPPTRPLDARASSPSSNEPTSPVANVDESPTPTITPSGEDPPPPPEPPASAPLAPPSSPVAAANGPGASSSALDVAPADAAFLAKRYEEAGRLYSALDREGRLPAGRKDHWAYCRWAEVVRRINARPTTPNEWAEIDAEIEQIRALSPNNWYGEYLRNRASERIAGGKAKASNRVVVRGSAPDETATVADPRKAQSAPPLAPLARPIDRPAARAASPSRGPGPDAAGPLRPMPAGPVRWQVHETANFRIHHNDPALAEKAAEVAEAARLSQVVRWAGSAPRGSWSPKCEIYLYPTARIFSEMTGQPEPSPGFSTMGMSGGRIVARRVNLRVDHPNLLKAILPHEITHVVLADLFPQQQIPRWADEGMAVLAEPASEQHMRAADLVDPLASGQLFNVEQLMAMDYPEGKFWGLYYAQSVSLTRFLVEQATPARFVQFVQDSQRNGVEAELRRIYKIEGYPDLHKRWLAYAQGKSVERTATAIDAERQPAARR